MSTMTKDPDAPEVKQWWARYPMTYGQNHGELSWLTEEGVEQHFEVGTKEFFEKVDENFYRWNSPLHRNGARFGRITCPVMLPSRS